jgi:N-methylhydantoinase B
VFLVRGGRLQRDVLDLVLANVRTPEERRADLAAQLGAQATGERRLIDLARRGRAAGGAGLVRAAAALMDHAERRVRSGLSRLPRGRFRFADFLDDDGLGSGPVRIAVTLTLAGERVHLDFTGSAAQTRGPVNAVEAVTRAASYYAVRCVLGGDLPVNDGTFRPILVTAPLGTVVNPRPPAAVAAGNVETSQRIVDVVLGAFARALPGVIAAASYGTMSNLLIGGRDARGRPFAYYETLAGGHGAGPGWHGASAMQAHMTNTRNTPVEALEHAYPLRVETTRIRRGSGGRGRWRGGDGIERSLRLLEPARVTVMSDRRRFGPYGLAGGTRGAVGVNRVRSGAARATQVRMPGKFQIDLGSGAVLTVASPGGGGYGRAEGRTSRRRPARRPRRAAEARR